MDAAVCRSSQVAAKQGEELPRGAVSPPESSPKLTEEKTTAAPSEVVTEVQCGWLHLLWRFLSLSLPSVVAGGLFFGQKLANTAFIGRTGSEVELAAVALGNTIQNCTALVFCLGVCGAMDSLVSQACGAGQRERCCNLLQFARILASLQLLWLVPVFWFTEELLLAIGQEPDVAHYAAIYNRATLPGLFPFLHFEAARRFLLNMGCTAVPGVIGLLCFVGHIGWLALFVGHLGMGNAGAGYAISLTWGLQLVLISLYLYVRAPGMGLRRASVLGISRTCLRHWKTYSKEALAATVQVGVDFWFSEVLTLGVGYFGAVPLAAYASMCNLYEGPLELMFAMQGAAAALVGHEVGAGHATQAKRAARVAVASALSVWTLIALVMVTARAELAALVSGSAEVQAQIARLLAIMAAVGFLDCTQILMNGVLRGLGLQYVGARVVAFCYYLVGLPVAYVLAFHLGQGLDGAPFGALIANAASTGLLVMALRMVRWTVQEEQGECREPAAQPPAAKSLGDRASAAV